MLYSPLRYGTDLVALVFLAFISIHSFCHYHKGPLYNTIEKMKL